VPGLSSASGEMEWLLASGALSGRSPSQQAKFLEPIETRRSVGAREPALCCGQVAVPPDHLQLASRPVRVTGSCQCASYVVNSRKICLSSSRLMPSVSVMLRGLPPAVYVLISAR